MDQLKMNAVYTSLAMKRRYEVWFLRCGLADGSGAWWFRYLVMNPGRERAGTEATSQVAQVWATWFPKDGAPQSAIQGFPIDDLNTSARKAVPFHCHIAENGMDGGGCWGKLRLNGREIAWKLKIASHFGVVLSDKGWIGFSRSPHADARFSGEITMDGRKFSGEPLGFGVQGHNCGFRHRNYWRWMHAYFPQAGGAASTLETLIYEMPLGLEFRKAVLWHAGKATILKKIEEQEIVREESVLKWRFAARGKDGTRVDATVEAAAPGIHRLPYTKTDLAGTFPVMNASLARAAVRLGSGEILQCDGGAVLEMGGA